MSAEPVHRPEPASARGGARASHHRGGPPIPARHRLLVPLVAAHAWILFAWSLLRHAHYGSPAFDLGAYHSVLWNLAYHATPWNSLDRAHQWSTHLEIGLAWLAALYRVAPSPVWLWLLQTAACAAAAIPIEAIARRLTRDPVVSLLAAAATLLTPQLVLGELADFHALAVCALPVAVIVWAVEANKSRALALAALAAILVREQMGLIVAVAAVAWVLRHGARRAPPAVILAALSLGLVAFELLVIIPSFGGAGQSVHYTEHYQRLGGSADRAVHTVSSSPFQVVAMAFEGDRKTYLLSLVGGALPLVLYSLRSLRRAAWPLLLALPQLGIQLLSDSPQKWDIHYQYGIPVVPLFAAAAAMALALVPEGSARIGPRVVSYRRLAAGGWVLLTAIHLVAVMPSPSGPGRPIDRAFSGSARAQALERAVAEVPADASISAQDDVVPHLASRSEVHCWPDGRATDDYVLLDLEGLAPNVKERGMLTLAVERLRRDKHFEVVVDEAGVLLVRRRGTETAGAPP